METTPFTTKSFSKDIDNKKIEIKLSSFENIISLSLQLNNKKYRLVISLEELQNSQIFFKQFSSFPQTISALTKIITTTNNIFIKENVVKIIFNNFLDEEISLIIPKEEDDIDLVHINLKKYQIENSNLKKLLMNKDNKLKIEYQEEKLIKESAIIKDKEDIMIKNWISNNKNMSFHLIYKATRDGDDAKDFHKLCDEISPTLTLARTKNGNRFGGYTSAPYTKNSESKEINDPNAFVFSLDKKYKYNTNKPNSSITSNKNYGPYFGNSSAFYIGNKFLSQNSSYSNPSNDYKSPAYVLTGAEYFTLDELEVYKIDIE